MTFKIFVSVCLILGCAFVVYGRPKAFPPNADTDGLAGLASLASFSPIRIISRFSDTKLDVNPKNAENLEDPPPIDVSKFSLTQWTAKKEIQPNNGTSANVIRVKRAEEKVSSQKKGKGKKKKKGKKRKKGRKRRKKKKKGSKKPEHEKKTKKPEIVKKKYPIKVEVGPVTTKKKKVKDITVKKEKLKKVKGDSENLPKRIRLKSDLGKNGKDAKAAQIKRLRARLLWVIVKAIIVGSLVLFIVVIVIIHCIRAKCQQMKLVRRHKEDVKNGESPPPVPSILTVSNQLCGCGTKAKDKAEIVKDEIPIKAEIVKEEIPIKDDVDNSKKADQEITKIAETQKSKIDVKEKDMKTKKSKEKVGEKKESSSEEEEEEDNEEEESEEEESDSKKVPKRIGLKKGKGHVDPKSANGKSILSRIIWALIKIIFVFMLIVFIIIHVIVHCIRARCKRMKLVARHKEDVKKGKSPPPVPSLMTVSNQLCGCGIEANDKDGVGSSKEIMEKTDNKKSKIDVKTEDTEKGKSKAKEAEKNESSSEEENEEEANEEEGQNEEEGENEEEGD